MFFMPQKLDALVTVISLASVLGLFTTQGYLNAAQTQSPLKIEHTLTCEELNYQQVFKENVPQNFTGRLYELPSGELCLSNLKDRFA